MLYFPQTVTLYIMCVLGLLGTYRALAIYKWHASALIVTCIAQFGQKMILGSMYASFLPVGAMSLFYMTRQLRLKGDGIVNGAILVSVIMTTKRYFVVLQCGFQLALTFALTSALTYIVKGPVLHLDADEHIYKFLLGKFGVR